MTPIAPSSLRRSATAVLAALALSATASADIVYNDFSSVAGLQLNGSAAQSGSVLRLTNDLWQSGSAFSTNTVSLASNASFSSYFSFQISDPTGIGDGDGVGADGIAFLVQTVSNTYGGAGVGIGYSGLPKSVAIEFDTYNNGGIDDNNGNHVGININGNLDSLTQFNYPIRLNNSAVWHAWADYNGATTTLEIRLSDTNLRPLNSLLSTNVDLASVLTTNNAYVGFTSGTGAASGDHDILSWEFRDTYNPVGVPDSSSAALLLGSSLFGLLAISKRRRR